ncbi:MAG: CDP-diacylglycerol--serine O-phosphatidyltransferase [bacterium]|nr:CDP-diacylglycerol--serine O-phosphatidyltransferase [bacterium]
MIEVEDEQVRLKKALFARENFRGKAFLIPSFVTVVGVFCGFISIIYSTRGNNLAAAFGIALSILIDGIDGRIARKLNATSPFGREFDSLSDAICLGVAPAVLMYKWGAEMLASDLGILICFSYIVCGAARLARFNITEEGTPSGSFQGLPIPGAAGALIALVYAHPAPLTSETLAGLALGYTLLVALLMVSTIPFLSLKHIHLNKVDPKIALLGLSFFVALTWYSSQVIALLVATGYAMSGPAMWIMRLSQKKKNNSLH